VARATSWVGRWLRRLGGLALLAGLLLVAALLRGPPERLTDAGGATVRVMDGDSLRIGERIVRLEGIDAVELHQGCRAGDVQWSCGLEAREALRDLVARGGLVCEAHGRDRYGRTIAPCAVDGLPDIGVRLVEQGWAVPLREGDGARYDAAAEAARAAKRGIWRGTFERPADWRAAHPRED